MTTSVRLWQVRALTAWRSARRIARAEPLWFTAVLGLGVVGLLWGLPRLEGAGEPSRPAAVVVALAALLEGTRRDERLIAILGARLAYVRFVDAILWLSPVLAYLAVRMPASALLAILGIAGVAALPLQWISQSRRASRTYSPRGRMVSAGALEWVRGLRRAPWPVLGGTTLGVVGPAEPLVGMLAMLIVSVSATAFHWTPSPGWLLIDAARTTPRRYLWRKVAVSCGLLGIALTLVVASVGLRMPSLWPIFAVFALGCLVAHAAGILCRFAEYAEGTPLSAGGALIWFGTVGLLVMLPAALLVLLFLERRAVRRLTPFCASPRQRADR